MVKHPGKVTGKKAQSVRTTVTLPSEDYHELERLAEQKKVSVAWVVRAAVEKYLNAEIPLFRKGG